jgi:hypothetical protein
MGEEGQLALPWNTRIRFLIDEDVPVSVGHFLESRGHEVTWARDEFMPKTPDEFLARWSDENQAVVVTCNARDFRRLVRRVPAGGRTRFRRASLITLECAQSRARQRIEQVIDSIEFEYVGQLRRHDPRLMIEVKENRFSVVR